MNDLERVLKFRTSPQYSCRVRIPWMVLDFHLYGFGWLFLPPRLMPLDAQYAVQFRCCSSCMILAMVSSPLPSKYSLKISLTSRCGLRVDDPALLVLRVFHIAVWGLGERLAALPRVLCADRTLRLISLAYSSFMIFLMGIKSSISVAPSTQSTLSLRR